MNQCQLSDSALDFLQNAPKLEELQLVDNPITDLGIDKLNSLPSLRALSLTGTFVTPNWKSRLHRRLRAYSEPPYDDTRK
jgi:hypothetical protein